MTDLSTQLIMQREGFSSSAYWDVNHWRVGYGSDTWVDANGTVRNVTKDTTVTAAEAAADLARRVAQTQQHVIDQIGQVAWDGLGDGAKAGLTSFTYNYGSLTPSVARAAQAGDNEAIAAAIEARGVDNGGVNSARRTAEAAVVLGHPVPGASIPNVTTNTAGPDDRQSMETLYGPAPTPLTPPATTVSAKFNDTDEVPSPFITAPTPMPGRPASLDATAAPAQHLVNLNGKMVPVGTYPSPSNPGSTVTVTDDGNGKAVVKVTDPGFAGGIKPGTIAGSIVGKAVADAAAQAAAAAPQVLDNVGNAANAAKDQIGSIGTGLVSGAGSLLSGLFGGGSKAPAVPAPTSDYTQTANGSGAKALDRDGTPVDGFTVTHTGWDNGRPVMEVDGSPVIVRASIPDATVARTAPRMLNPTMFLTGADQLTFTPPKTLSEALAGTSYADMGPALDMHFAKTAPPVDIADAHDKAMIAAAPKAPAPSTATVKPQSGITKITTQGVQPAGTVQMPADVHPRVGNKGGYEDLGPGLPSFDEFSKSMGITAVAPVPAKLTPAPQRPAAVVPPAVTTVTETKINPEYTAWQAQYGGLSTGTKATTVSAKFNDTDVGTVSAKFNDRDGTAPPVVATAPVAPPPPKKYITITKKVAAPPIGTPPVSNPRPVAPPVDTGPAYITAQGNMNRQQTHDALMAQQGKNMSGLITTPGSNKGYTVDKSGSSYESALQPG